MHVYIVGGAAMALSYDERRATKDIDGLYTRSNEAATIIHELALEYDLPGDWLNSACRPYVPGHDAVATTLEIPGLSVSAASPKHLLAMKMAAFRPQDHKDLRLLFHSLGIADPKEAVDIVFNTYGTDYAAMFRTPEDYLLRAEAILSQMRSEKPRMSIEGVAKPDSTAQLKPHL